MISVIAHRGCSDSLGRSCPPSDPLSFLDILLAPHPDSVPVLRVCWDLDQFLAPFLRLLPLHVLSKLSSTRRAFFRPYSMFYIPGKFFSVRMGRAVSFLYSLSQYFPGSTPDPASSSDILPLAHLLLLRLDSVLGIRPLKLTSPVAVYSDFVLSKLSLPTVADVPEQSLGAADYALRCSGRLWISAFQVGHWSDSLSRPCHGYDLVSAFSSEARSLPDTRAAAFIKSRSYVPGARWGFLRGRVTVNTHGSLVSPVIADVNGDLVCPDGSWLCYLTLDEVRFIERWGLGSFRLHDGWFLTFPADAPRPLKSVMEGLHSRRGQDPVSDAFIKRAANGVVGKFLETHDDGSYGDYFNPFWHAMVTARVRLRVCDFLLSNHVSSSELIHIGVDGFLSTRMLPVPPVNGMGVWRYDGSDPCAVVSPGLVFSGGERPSKPKGIVYSVLLDMVRGHPRSSRYEVKLPRRVTLAEAVEWGDISLVGVVRDFPSVVDLTSARLSQDRTFLKFPSTGESLLSNVYLSKAKCL